MKSIRSLLGAIALFGCATLAVNAQSVNPSDPHFLFPNQVQAQTATPPPAAVTPTAHVTVSAPPTDPITQVIQGIEAALMALLTAFAVPALNKIRTGATATDASGKPTPASISTIVSSIFHPGGTSIIADPATRAAVDAALLQIVQSGVPGGAIQSGLGMIPGVGPFAGIIEGIARKAAISELTARAGANATTLGQTDPSPMNPSAVAVPAEALTALNGILKELSGKLPFPLKAS